jgi:hypothetical protein
MKSVTHIAQALERILQDEIEELAKEVGFLKRQRVLSAADFVQSLIFGWLQEPEISLDGLTQVLQRRDVSISASGMSQRFTSEAATLLQRVLERLCEQQMQVEEVEVALLRQFSAVVIEDSSSIALPDELAQVWSGWGKKGTHAAVKLFVRWDVLRGRLQGPELSDGRRNDHRSPFAVEELPEGCLYVADLGFYSLQHFCALAGRADGKPRRAKRFFVSRWQPGTVLRTRQGHRLELRGILPQHIGQRVELGAILMQRGRNLPVRLLIERVPRGAWQNRDKNN